MFSKPPCFEFPCFLAYSYIQPENIGLNSKFRIPFISKKDSSGQGNLLEFIKFRIIGAKSEGQRLKGENQ